MYDDCECGLEGLEDNAGLRKDIDRDLGEEKGLGAASDCGSGVDVGVVASFESVFRVWIFLDVCQDVSRKPELRPGRF